MAIYPSLRAQLATTGARVNAWFRIAVSTDPYQHAPIVMNHVTSLVLLEPAMPDPDFDPYQQIESLITVLIGPRNGRCPMTTLLDCDRVWAAIDAQRPRVADMLDQLTDDEWQHDSLCQGWTVQDVAAHLTQQQVTWFQILRFMIKYTDGGINELARERAGAHSTKKIIAEMRGMVGSRRRKAGLTHRRTLIDALVHGQDIAVATGRSPRHSSGRRSRGDHMHVDDVISLPPTPASTHRPDPSPDRPQQHRLQGIRRTPATTGRPAVPTLDMPTLGARPKINLGSATASTESARPKC